MCWLFFTIFGLSQTSTATVLDELRTRHLRVKELCDINLKYAGAYGLAVVPEMAIRCAMVCTLFLAKEGCKGKTFLAKCMEADEAVGRNRVALDRIYQAKHFLKEVEIVYQRTHFPHARHKKFNSKNLTGMLAQISSAGLTFDELIDEIHELNRTGMDNLVSRHDISRNPRTVEGSGVNAYYTAPDYVVLIKQFLIKTINARKNALQRAQGEGESFSMVTAFSNGVPQDFLCPITQEIMYDPVVTMDGHSYERTAIEEWFRRGGTNSPRTGATLTDRSLVPNHALRLLIEEFLEATGVPADEVISAK